MRLHENRHHVQLTQVKNIDDWVTGIVWRTKTNWRNASYWFFIYTFWSSRRFYNMSHKV